MKKLSILFLGLTLLSSPALAQSTPEALGQITFTCFQQNNLDSLYELIPSIADLTAFGLTVGLDTTSDHYKQLVNDYPATISDFKRKCARLLNSSTELNFNWAIAKLDKIETSQKALSIRDHDSSETVTITVVDIYFLSNEKRFKLTLEDANRYGGIWRPGGYIKLIQLRNTP